MIFIGDADCFERRERFRLVRNSQRRSRKLLSKTQSWGDGFFETWDSVSRRAANKYKIYFGGGLLISYGI